MRNNNSICCFLELNNRSFQKSFYFYKIMNEFAITVYINCMFMFFQFQDTNTIPHPPHSSPPRHIVTIFRCEGIFEIASHEEPLNTYSLNSKNSYTMISTTGCVQALSRVATSRLRVRFLHYCIAFRSNYVDFWNQNKNF